MRVIALVLLIALTACSNGITGNIIGQSIPEEEGTIDVYFCPRHDCMQVLVDFVSQDEDVKCAFYDLTHENAIAELRNRDVLVDAKEFRGIGQPVTAAGIMHNKFCIIDENTILTGSFNPTGQGINHRNNIVIVKSKYLAENYLSEFNELKTMKQSQGKPVKYPKVKVSGILIENYFCPEDDCELHVLETLEKAKDSIYFMTYSFTSDPIGDLLVEKASKGKEVKGIFEKQQISKWSEHSKLEKAGIPVKIDEQKYLLHNKIFIVDEKIVITGSYNPSKNANENNDENIVIIHDEAIASLYLEEFEAQWIVDETS